MHYERQSRATLTAVEMDHGDSLDFIRRDGRRQRIEIDGSSACIDKTTLATPKVPEPHGHTELRMHVRLHIDGVAVQLVRWISNDRSFVDPHLLNGLWVWFDVCASLFDHLNEDHGSCAPQKDVRLVIWEQGIRPCPTLLHPWCPLPEDGLRISDCYDSDDCWLGAYQGADAHGGLDINHPAGTVLVTPLAIDRHHFFNHIDRGDNNNRWRGEIDWPDGCRWALQAHHIIELLVPLDRPIAAGTPYATSAGMLTGVQEHSHFVFAVKGPEDDEEIRIDPWLLFRQMLLDRRSMIAGRAAAGGAICGSLPPL